MKQPELGKKLAEIRNRKGITQQEIADQCNLNIRTVQRVESGEVNPRLYTIRLYLKCLGHEFEQVMEDKPTDKNMNDTDQYSLLGKTKLDILKYAWIGGIVYFLIGFPEAHYGREAMETPLNRIDAIVYFFIKFISFFSYACFMGGFIEIANRHRLKLMKTISIILIICCGAFAAFEMIAIFSGETIKNLVMGESLSFGPLFILFGVTLFRSEQHFGRKGVLAGSLEVLAGLTFVTVVLGFIGLIIQIPAIILEIIILYLAQSQSESQPTVAHR